MDAPPLVVVMGVSGCGKSTVGPLIAAALGAEFIEGDTLHPPENVARMASGTPLTDADRAPWLQTVATRLAQAAARGQALVVSCSALKRRYRDVLRGGAPGVAFVHVEGDAALIGGRLAARRGHYMPASLLASQLDSLEPPGRDERALAVPAALPPAAQAEQALAWLHAPTESPR